MGRQGSGAETFCACASLAMSWRERLGTGGRQEDRGRLVEAGWGLLAWG